ncbi:MAG: nitroreductase/quinone reductase family protein [Candidatus Promineifilaceae bacterium]|nr:nitroreductase/quinone reductase family protein [Candidatus Promineifilaceae bacterium]
MNARTRTAAGEERERLWSFIVEKDSDYKEYQERTARQIPIVVSESEKPGI